MIGSQKPNGKGQGVGYTEVPPPGNYSFLPKDETKLMNFVSTSVKEVDPITVDLPDNPVSLKESVGSNSTPHQVDEDTKDETVKTFKKGSSIKSSRKRIQMKWSCFKCHNKGHVVSCCPLKKNKQKNDVVQDGNRVGSNNNVQPSCQTNQPKFQSKTSTSGRFYRPRSFSPQFSHFSGKSNRFQRNNFGFQNRYQTSGYRNFQRKNEYRSFRNSNGQNNPRFFRKSDSENWRRRDNNFQRSANQRVYWNSYDQRSSGNYGS